jgi:MFS transporter, ACS family, hexuronate transporter
VFKTNRDKALFANSRIPAGRLGLRWWICGTLFVITTINYGDRQVISLLEPNVLSKIFNWTPTDYSYITAAFLFSYAIGYFVCGWLADAIGVWAAFALTAVVFSVAQMGHALVASVLGFVVVRSILGISEGGLFPMATKAVAEWFPQRERSLSFGLFNAGSSLAVVLGPLFVPWLALRFGWQASFVVTGGLGLIWVIWWCWFYKAPQRHPRLSERELEHIGSDPLEEKGKAPLMTLLKCRQMWMFAVGMLTASVWWFYLYWAPDFFARHHKLDLKHVGLPLIVVYLMADFGSIFSGWFSSHLIKRGWSVNAARKIPLLLCSIGVLPVFMAPRVSEWPAALLIGLAAACHQGFSANLYPMVSDTVPGPSAATVMGLGGMIGTLVGAAVQLGIGQNLQFTNNNYNLLFDISAVMYLAVLLVMHLINPRLEKLKLPAVIAIEESTETLPGNLLE